MTKPLSRVVLDAEVKRLGAQWPSMPLVTVVDHVSDLPDDVGNELCDGYRRHGHRDVYVVASNISSLQQLQKVMAHECVLHYALEDMLGDYGFAKLHEGVQSLKAAGERTIVELAAEVGRKYGDLSEHEETREIIAAAGERFLNTDGSIKVEFGIVKSLYAGVAGWLRDQGITVPFTNFELQGLIHAAVEHIHEPALEAPQIRGVKDDPAVIEGSYSGKIISVSGDDVIQKIGRGADDTVTHHHARLSEPVGRGDIVDITYRSGKGTVEFHGHQLER